MLYLLETIKKGLKKLEQIIYSNSTSIVCVDTVINITGDLSVNIK